MLKQTAEVIKNNRGYFILALILAAAVIFMQNSKFSGHEASPQAQEALAELRQAEEDISVKLSDRESIEKFLNENPEARTILTLLVLGGLFLFGAGFCLETVFVFNPRFRQRIQSDAAAPDGINWHYSMIPKLLLLFFSVSLALGVSLALLHAFVFKSLNMNALILAETTLMDIAALSVIIYLVRRYGGTWRSLGFRTPLSGIWREIMAGAAAYVAIFPIFIGALVVLVVAAKLAGYEPPPHPLIYIFLEEEKTNPFLVGYSIFLASVIAPVLEEIFFRGFLYPVIRRYWGVFWAAALTAVIFAAIHRNLFAFLPIVVLGSGLAYIYEKRRSLAAPITMHLLHNTVFLGYFFLAKKVLMTGAS